MDRDELRMQRGLGTPRLVVFDVGGVLVRLDHGAREAHLRPTPEGSLDLPALAATNRQFRLGEIGADTYIERTSRIYAVSRQAVEQAEAAFLAGVFPDMAAYVRRLRQHVRVVCLSNTQILHWQAILDHWLGPDVFDACYLSHEMGMEKPQADIYAELARREGVSGAEIVFIDDTPENIEAAKEAGWTDSILHVSEAATMQAIDNSLHRAQPAAAMRF